MPNLNIDDYIIQKNSWESLRNFIIDNYISDSSIEDTDKAAKRYLQETAKEVIGGNDKQTNEFLSFDRTIRNYINNKYNSFEKANLYRLLFTLNIDNVPKVLHFCRTVIHQNELSARSLDDFIVLSCLKLHVSYQDYKALDLQFKSRVKEIHHDPELRNYSVTGENLDNIINNINSVDDMVSFISNNINRFAVTRNTTYTMLFDEVDWEVWSGEQWAEFYKFNPKYAPEGSEKFNANDWDNYSINNDSISNELMQQLIIYTCTDDLYDDAKFDPKYIDKLGSNLLTQSDYLRKDKKKLSVRDYYMHRFTIWENGLSEEQIQALSKDPCYSTAFISYDKFKAIFERKSDSEITHGVYLISLLQKYFDDEDSGYSLFSPDTDFINECNNILDLGGFANLSDNNPFDKLFKNTFYEVLNEHNNIKSIDIKGEFLERLCYYLKQVADKLIESQKQL